MPAPPSWSVVALVVAAWCTSAALGALSNARIATRPAADLVRGE
jgi:hypothetical protein